MFHCGRGWTGGFGHLEGEAGDAGSSQEGFKQGKGGLEGQRASCGHCPPRLLSRPLWSSQVRPQLSPGLKGGGWLLMTDDGHWGPKRMPQSRSVHPRPLASTALHGKTPGPPSFHTRSTSKCGTSHRPRMSRKFQSKNEKG